jgi:hypothetical protein
MTNYTERFILVTDCSGAAFIVRTADISAISKELGSDKTTIYFVKDRVAMGTGYTLVRVFTYATPDELFAKITEAI